MSSPSKISGSNASVGIRDGTRVILREITANLHNSSPGTSPRRKTGNEASSSKIDNHQQPHQHDVKVRFIREFADAGSTTVRDEIPDISSLSSASSFQSLASTLSSKCSSGICVDSSPSKNPADNSYLTSDISGLDDLITACENINLDDTSKEEQCELRVDSEENNTDETFKSATDQSSLDRTRENSPIAFANEVDRNFEATTNIEREDASPFDRPDEIHRNLNFTTDTNAATSPLNGPEESDVNLNVTTEIRGENSPINARDEANFNLNVTTEIKRDNSSINARNEGNFHLDVTTEIKRENSPINSRNEGYFDLNVTAEITRDNSPVNCDNRHYYDRNNTTGIRNDDFDKNFQDGGHSDLNVTKDLNADKSTTNSISVNLDATRVLTEEYTASRTNFDLNDTREVSGEASSPNSRSEKKRDFNEGENISSTINDLESPSLARENCPSPAQAESIENFVDCINDIGQFFVTEKPEKAPGKIDDSSIVTQFTDNRNDDGLKRCEEYPLELITPSISQFNENLCHENIDERINRTEVSFVETSSSFNIEEFKVSENNEKLDEGKKSLINGSVENTQYPTLPTFSSISSFTDKNDKTNLPIVPIDAKNDRVGEISAPTISESKIGIADNEFHSVDSTSSIEKTNFFTAQTFRDKSIEIHDVGTGEFSSTRKYENLECAGNFGNLDLERLNSTKNFGARSSNERCNLVNEKNIEDQKNSIIEESDGINAEIEKESFPEVADKIDNSNEDLNATVIAENSSTEDISALPEPLYDEFVPQRQSTTFHPHREFQSKKSPLSIDTADARNIISRPASLKDDYSAFIPQKQSTTIDNFTSPLSSKFDRQKTPKSTSAFAGNSSANGENSKTLSNNKIESFENRCNFAQLELAANSVANDIFNSSLEIAEENEHFVSAESELFHDPTNFDFLLSKTPKKNTKRNLRELSLYVKFDPLVSNTSMLPQGNIQNASPPVNEARNGDNNTAIPNIGTPKLNPAIAAIDRLLFWSPMTTNTETPNANATIPKSNDVQEKLKPAEETSEETINMAKELELVRTTVLQLEEQLEKMKIDHEEALEKEASYKEKINQLQAQLAQEIKHKNEITVVVDEYEISISRLVAERERDRKNLDLEKAKLQEELAAAKHHLDNTEAAFNDVHLKYERLKAVVATYKNNEAALKDSLQENVEIIKSLENRYEQVKSHATARLEKANQDLEEIRKQNEAENVRLQAMLRKAELKSNSLAELVEQKTKENKELAQILDEVIARVGRNKAQ